MQELLGDVNADTIMNAGVERLQSTEITCKKAEYITDFARKVKCGQFDIDAVSRMSDEDAVRALSSLSGIGAWTAEMILLSCLRTL